LGDVDVMIQISGDTIKTAQVFEGQRPARARDNRIQDGGFRTRPGRGWRRDHYRDRVDRLLRSKVGSLRREADPKAKLRPTPKAALDALFECIADNPTSPPRDPHVPAGVTGVSLDTWRDRLMKLAIINAKGSHREQFKRIRVTLQTQRS